MNLTQQKERIVDILETLAAKEYVCNDDSILKSIQKLQAEINNDFYTILVLGEFKRGKSTFINALLGKSILPMDVLPETATINALMYNEEPKLSVVYNDGSTEKGEVSYEYLSQFSAQNDKNIAHKVKYIKIGYPLDLLENRIVLVDTPGVSDMDEQRCDVTYQFLPTANAVIFLLDANSPLKKTEHDFIVNRILPLGVSNILFLLNKYDDFDDEEEDDDLVAEVQLSIDKMFADAKANIKTAKVYPFSAKQALKGLETNNPALIKESYLELVREKLNDMIFNGDIEQDKVDIYKHHLLAILDRLTNELINDKKIKQASQEELQDVISALNKLVDEKEHSKQNITGYIDESKTKIRNMTTKSLKFFQKKLEDDILDMVKTYESDNFKNFIEITITKRIQKSLESWTGLYSPKIDKLLKQLEYELARGVSTYFNQQIQVYTETGKEIKSHKYALNITANDISDVNLKSGAAAAAGSAVLLAVSGGFLLPIIGFAALPFLRKKLLNQKLAEAKATAIPEIKAAIAKSLLQMQTEIFKYIDTRCQMIASNTEYAYGQVLLKLKANVDKQLNDKKLTGEQIQYAINNLDNALAEIKQIKEEIQ